MVWIRNRIKIFERESQFTITLVDNIRNAQEKGDTGE